jgi:two-component system, NarL family, sensor histidine kinase UhpB
MLNPAEKIRAMYQLHEKLHLLLVTDNNADRSFFAYVLNITFPECEVYATLSPADDPAIAADFAPHIIFLDFSFLQEQDPALLARIQDRYYKVPIVLLAASNDPDVAGYSLAAATSDYLFIDEVSPAALKKCIVSNTKYRLNTKNVINSLDRYQLLTKAINNIVWDWDFTKRRAYWVGNGLQTILGYDCFEMNVDSGYWDENLHPDDKDRVLSRLAAILEGGLVDHWDDEYRFKKKDGSYCYIYDRGFIIYNNKIPTRLIGSMEDITEKVALQKKLEAEINLNQKQLPEAVVSAQEKERTEIGKELHDNVNQLLSASRLYIEAAKTDPVNGNSLLSQASEYIMSAIEEIRILSKVLNTPLIHELGLCESVDNLADDLMAVNTIHVMVNKKSFDEKGLHENFKLTLFRIIQEQITNILKHANAKEANIHLSRNEHTIILTISDNGIGFDTSKKRKGIGLSNINSRAALYNGKLVLSSEQGKGSILSVVFPVADALAYEQPGTK